MLEKGGHVLPACHRFPSLLTHPPISSGDSKIETRSNMDVIPKNPLFLGASLALLALVSVRDPDPLDGEFPSCRGRS